MFIIFDGINKVGYDFHILLIITKGLSKNTYDKIIQSVFPEFGNRNINVQAVKSLKRTVSYIIRDINLHTLVQAINGIYTPSVIVANTDLKVLFSQRMNKLDPTLRDACIIAIILSYDNYELFRVKEAYLGLSSVSQSAKYKQMWELRRRLIIPEKIIDRILAVSCSREIYLQLVKNTL